MQTRLGRRRRLVYTAAGRDAQRKAHVPGGTACSTSRSRLPTPPPPASATTAIRSTCCGKLPDDSVALVMTSPPFALRRQKAYGNVAAVGIRRMVLAVRRRDPPRAAARRQLRPRPRRGLEPRQRHALAVSIRADPRPGADVPPGPGVLLVQPEQAADAGRVGHHPPHARQGRRDHAVVAVQDRNAAGRQPPRAAAVQPVDEAAAARRLRHGPPAVAARHRPALPPRQRRRHPAQPAADPQHALQRRVLPPLPRRRAADPPGALSRTGCRSSSSAS